MALVDEKLVKSKLLEVYEIILDLCIIQLVELVLIVRNGIFDFLDGKALFTIRRCAFHFFTKLCKLCFKIHFFTFGR